MTTSTDNRRPVQDPLTTMAYSENSMNLALELGRTLGQWITRINGARMTIAQPSAEATS